MQCYNITKKKKRKKREKKKEELRGVIRACPPRDLLLDQACDLLKLTSSSLSFPACLLNLLPILLHSLLMRCPLPQGHVLSPQCTNICIPTVEIKISDGIDHLSYFLCWVAGVHLVAKGCTVYH